MWRGIRGSAKDLLAGALEISGLLSRQMDQSMRGKVVVLTYHRVLPQLGRDSFSAPGIIVTPETFDRHLQWIRSHLHPVTAAEFAEVLEGVRTPPHRACLLTFDDGWFDSLAYALPALERYDVPALLFAATGYIGGSQCLWQERLTRLLHAAWKAGPPGLALLGQMGASTPLELPESAARPRIRVAVTRLKSLAPAQIESLIRQVERDLVELGISLPKHFGDDRFLSWAELQELASSRCLTIGSHAVSHSPIPRLSLDAKQAELSQSKALLESRLGTEIDWFAYPNGDYDDESIAQVRESGYRGAFSTREGMVTPQQDNFALRRVHIHEDSTRTPARFLCRVSGLQ